MVGIVHAERLPGHHGGRYTLVYMPPSHGGKYTLVYMPYLHTLGTPYHAHPVMAVLVSGACRVCSEEERGLWAQS